MPLYSEIFSFFQSHLCLIGIFQSAQYKPRLSQLLRVYTMRRGLPLYRLKVSITPLSPPLLFQGVSVMVCLVFHLSFPLSILIIDIQAPARAEYERKELLS